MPVALTEVPEDRIEGPGKPVRWRTMVATVGSLLVVSVGWLWPGLLRDDDPSSPNGDLPSDHGDAWSPEEGSGADSSLPATTDLLLPRGTEPQLFGTSGFDVAAGDGPVWQVRTEPCGRTQCAHVMRTTTEDDYSWESLRTFRSSYPIGWGKGHRPSPDVTGVTVAKGDRHAWVYGTQVWSTHDGGDTWNRLPDKAWSLGTRMQVIGDYVYALSGDPADRRLLRSPVRKDAWSRISGPRVDQYDEFLAVGDALVIQGSCHVLRCRFGNKHYSFISHDRGSTWRGMTAPCRPPTHFGLKSNGALLLASCGSSTPGQLSLFSSRRGIHWRHVGHVGRGGRLEQLAPINANTAMAIYYQPDGEYNAKLVTQKGAEWIGLDEQLTAFELYPWAYEDDVLFATPHRGYMVTWPEDQARQLLETTDGGRTWIPLG